MAAVKKVKSEMEENKANPYVQVVGKFLLDHLEKQPEDAKFIENKDKTIIGSLSAMRKEAEKKKVNGCAVLTDQEGFQIVLEYFGVTENTEDNSEEIDFDFEDLLE